MDASPGQDGLRFSNFSPSKFKDDSMNLSSPRTRFACKALLLGMLFACGGCSTFGPRRHDVIPLPPVDIPRELTKVALPSYVIEPPDILLIDAVSVIPKGPHSINPLDVLNIQVTPTLPERPIAGPYVVEAEGTINLGPDYGAVRVVGMTLDEAAAAIKEHISDIIRDPTVAVSLLQSAAVQQIAGQHLVGPDGTVNLGVYGRVFVTGLTIEQARHKIEMHLSKFLQDPQIAVDVAGFNSKVYYIVTEGAGLGDGVVRVPVTGNETVLDAISQINGLSQVSSKRVWIARPAPDGVGCDQILPVDWIAITKGGSTTTNYQIMPGDRVFVAEDNWVSFDNYLAKVLAPFERMFGFTLLGAETIQTLQRFPGGFGAFGTGIFIP